MNIETFWKKAGIVKPIILASGSPRRADLLMQIGLPFEVVVPDIVEDSYGLWDDSKLLRRHAIKKAKAVKAIHPDRSVLAADTVVRIDSRVFGKPRSEQDAADMLKKLSGRRHEVWTAVCFLPETLPIEKIAITKTEVTFRDLTEADISAYVASGESMDKAGAYGIQGIGGLWVNHVQGCYFNVVGLPVSQLWDLLITSDGGL